MARGNKGWSLAERICYGTYQVCSRKAEGHLGTLKGILKDGLKLDYYPKDSLDRFILEAAIIKAENRSGIQISPEDVLIYNKRGRKIKRHHPKYHDSRKKESGGKTDAKYDPISKKWMYK